MSKRLITKQFFQENPYLESSVQRFIYSLLLYEEIEELASDMAIKKGGLSEERLHKITMEKEQIQAEENPEEILQLLRKKVDGINRVVLIRKALEFEEVILPMVLEKLNRNSHDIFIENAIRVLARSKNDYTKLLKEQYSQIRSPYAQSLVCLVIGFRGTEACIPWMIDKYFEFKKLYPLETYNQGPLLGLHEMNERLYKK